MASNAQLIEAAASVVSPKKVGDFTIGDVGCALETEDGNIYLGVCVDTSSSMGFCAEHNAIGTMITEGEYKIKRIVAVYQDKNDDVYVVSPCGRCREFIYQIDEANLATEVILGLEKTVPLSELLPYNDMYHKVER